MKSRAMTTPLAVMAILVAICAAGMWLRSASDSAAEHELVGASRAELETRWGRAPFTARDFVVGNRDSVRRGGLRMGLVELSLRGLKIGRGLGASQTNRVLVWIDDARIHDHARRATVGDLEQFKIDTAVAVDQSGVVRLARLDEHGRVAELRHLRPNFMVVQPD